MASSKDNAPSRDSDRLIDRLTKPAVDAIPEGEYRLFAGRPGLRLVAGKSSRTFVYRYRAPSGAIRQTKIGEWPAWSYAAAAARWEDLRDERKKGGDPALDARKAREQRARDVIHARLQSYTVAKMVEDYLTNYIDRNRAERGAMETRRMLEKDFTVRPLGLRPAAEVTRSEAVAMLAKLAARTSSAAREGRREMVAAFDFAVSHSHIPEDAVNPWEAAKRDKALRKLIKTGRGTRFLTDAEIATFSKWLPTSKLSRTVKDALALVLMTGVRSGEAVAAKWTDIKLDAGTWTLPVTKTDTPRTIRLPKRAIELLRQRVDVHDEFVFPRPDGVKPVRQHAIVWALGKYGRSSGLAEWSAHDLRRTVRTGLSRLQCPHEVAEAAIGHTRGSVAGIYDLHKYEAEVGAWLQRWCDHVDALASPTITSIRARA